MSRRQRHVEASVGQCGQVSTDTVISPRGGPPDLPTFAKDIQGLMDAMSGIARQSQVTKVKSQGDALATRALVSLSLASSALFHPRAGAPLADVLPALFPSLAGLPATSLAYLITGLSGMLAWHSDRVTRRTAAGTLVPTAGEKPCRLSWRRPLDCA